MNMRSLLLLALISSISFAKTIRVAVVDTGLDIKNSDAPLCKTGHRDFTGTGLMDRQGHGTHISDVIDQYAKGVVRTKDVYAPYGFKARNGGMHYCQIIIKYYNDETSTGRQNVLRSTKALAYAASLNVDFINYSSGGGEVVLGERAAILRALRKNITIVAAAGNDGRNLDIQGNTYYPAMYSRQVISVGNRTSMGFVNSTSNYGKAVVAWEVGTAILAKLPNGQFGYLSGTSQAAAVHTGKLINQILMEAK